MTPSELIERARSRAEVPIDCLVSIYGPEAYALLRSGRPRLSWSSCRIPNRGFAGTLLVDAWNPKTGVVAGRALGEWQGPGPKATVRKGLPPQTPRGDDRIAGIGPRARKPTPDTPPSGR